jgi:hypothetical protein
MTTRSRVLAAGAITARVGGIVFTCPAAVVLVKSTYLTLTTASSPGVCSLVVVRPAGPFAKIFELELANLETHEWQGWLALEEGDQLQVNADRGTLYYWISGAELAAV